MNRPLSGAPATNRCEAIYPYKVMGNFLREQKRDIVFSLCQYGMADVWKWGGSVNGNCWRTTGDIGHMEKHERHRFQTGQGRAVMPSPEIGTIPTCSSSGRSAGASCIRRASRRTNNTRTSACGACCPRRCSSAAT
jgi:hypothetical protein